MKRVVILLLFLFATAAPAFSQSCSPFTYQVFPGADAMSGKPITGSGSLFSGLFVGPQSVKAKEDYLRALEEAAREVASWDDAEVSNELASDQKENKPKWLN